MAVAQVPGDADEFAVLMRMDFHQRFRLGAHVDDASVIQQQAVAITQTDRLWQVDKYFGRPRSSSQDESDGSGDDRNQSKTWSVSRATSQVPFGRIDAARIGTWK